jgi:hypothetical protein
VETYIELLQLNSKTNEQPTASLDEELDIEGLRCNCHFSKISEDVVEEIVIIDEPVYYEEEPYSEEQE